MVEDVVDFLDGRTGDVRQKVREAMIAASEREDYERAKDMRDALRWLERLEEPGSVEVMGTGDADVIGYARDGDDAVGVLMRVREGRVVGREHRFLEGLEEEEDAAVLSAFLVALLRAGGGAGPAPGDPVSAGRLGRAARAACRTRTGPYRSGAPRTAGSSSPTQRPAPPREPAHRVVRDRGARRGSGVRAGRDLGLSAVPRSLVCVDISHNQGKDTVGSLVWFEAGRPKKSEYRKFKIQGLGQQDDFAAIHEVITRYLTRRRDEALPLPDLIVIDGGKGQLNAALDAMEKLGLGPIPMVSLAKREEEVFLPGRAESLRLSRRSPSLRLLQRARDEAHRFGARLQPPAPHRRARSPPSCSTFPASGPTAAASCSSDSAAWRA